MRGCKIERIVDIRELLPLEQSDGCVRGELFRYAHCHTWCFWLHSSVTETLFEERRFGSAAKVSFRYDYRSDSRLASFRGGRKLYCAANRWCKKHWGTL